MQSSLSPIHLSKGSSTSVMRGNFNIVKNVLDYDYQQVINHTNFRPPSIQQQRIHSYIVDAMKSMITSTGETVWDNTMMIHLFGHNGDYQFSSENLKKPGGLSDGSNLSEFSYSYNPVIANSGFKGAGSVTAPGGFFLSDVAPVSQGASAYFQSFQLESQQGGTLFGARSGAGSNIILLTPRDTSNRTRWSMKFVVRVITGVTSAAGHWCMTADATTASLYKNNILIDSAASTSGLLNDKVYVLNNLNSGTLGNPSTATTPYFIWSKSETNEFRTQLYELFSYYISTLNLNIK